MIFRAVVEELQRAGGGEEERRVENAAREDALNGFQPTDGVRIVTIVIFKGLSLPCNKEAWNYSFRLEHIVNVYLHKIR